MSENCSLFLMKMWFSRVFIILDNNKYYLIYLKETMTNDYGHYTILT